VAALAALLAQPTLAAVAVAAAKPLTDLQVVPAL